MGSKSSSLLNFTIQNSQKDRETLIKLIQEYKQYQNEQTTQNINYIKYLYKQNQEILNRNIQDKAKIKEITEQLKQEYIKNQEKQHVSEYKQHVYPSEESDSSESAKVQINNFVDNLSINMQKQNKYLQKLNLIDRQLIDAITSQMITRLETMSFQESFNLLDSECAWYFQE
ncbi:Hypothetical_protein [Hexamita inflata]|uniref:Hypothetical_protein n=1 Tax=Hexamita inflata TaxID=28002 RepID=A0AA86R5B5_9EUKA|nr:Hypothetical protein HINF_LOCUS53829 [Hexamita inflata]